MRKNFPDAQKLSGRQCRRADGVFLPLGIFSVVLTPTDLHMIALLVPEIEGGYPERYGEGEEEEGQGWGNSMSLMKTTHCSIIRPQPPSPRIGSIRGSKVRWTIPEIEKPLPVGA